MDGLDATHKTWDVIWRPVFHRCDLLLGSRFVPQLSSGSGYRIHPPRHGLRLHNKNKRQTRGITHPTRGKR